ncbi:alpha/beta hydrolase [Streptomyces sp. NPDC050211]|uniref:alpha/beta hydrolase n=1 Tax=Streptomyces sp. NPDC050211 TaxID=3154932 RepID=UPI00343CE14B
MKTEVSFPSKGLKVAGILYLPDTYSGRPLPAVVVGHPWGSVKEQTASVYAERLAREGFAALVFDAAHQGESEGEPRNLEDPFQRTEDFRSAVSYLASRGDIDPDRVGGLGICASGGYLSSASQTDRRIKAVATVSAFDIAGGLFEGVGRVQGLEVRDALLDQAGVLRNAEARGEGVINLTLVPPTAAEAAAFPERSIYREGHEYYRTPRAQHPRSANWAVVRADVMAQYSAFAHQSWISPRPLLMIAGTDADTRYFSEEAIAQAAEPKELFLIEGATHIDLYDKDAYVTSAVAKLSEFFGKHLGL